MNINSFFCIFSIKQDYLHKIGDSTFYLKFIVSYYPKDKIQSDNEFMTDSMMLEDMFNDYFGEYAPLFCDEEEYFKLSPNAEVIKYESK